MDQFYRVNFARLKKLKFEVSHFKQEFDEAKANLESALNRLNYLEKYLREEVLRSQDPEAVAELEEILKEPNYRLEVRMMGLDEIAPKIKGFNKTHAIVCLWRKENFENRGVTPKGLYLLAQKSEYGKDINLAYTNNVLSRFRKIGRAEQRDGKYWLTESGKKYWEGIVREA